MMGTASASERTVWSGRSGLGSSYPWSFKQNFLLDSWSTNRADLDDGLVWTPAADRAGVGA